MHGFTNYEQSKALYERGYRHPKPVRYESTIGGRSSDQNFGFYNPEQYPAFSLADIFTMQGERFYIPPQVPVSDVIEYNMKYLLKQTDAQVELCNQRLREVYE